MTFIQALRVRGAYLPAAMCPNIAAMSSSSTWSRTVLKWGTSQSLFPGSTKDLVTSPFLSPSLPLSSYKTASLAATLASTLITAMSLLAATETPPLLLWQSISSTSLAWRTACHLTTPLEAHRETPHCLDGNGSGDKGPMRIGRVTTYTGGWKMWERESGGTGSRCWTMRGSGFTSGTVSIIAFNQLTAERVQTRVVEQWPGYHFVYPKLKVFEKIIAL